MYLPVALLTSATAAQNTLDPMLTRFDGCTEPWILMVGFFALATTQLRSRASLERLSFVSLACVSAVVCLAAALITSNPLREDSPGVFLLGNPDMLKPERSTVGWSNFCLGMTLTSRC